MFYGIPQWRILVKKQCFGIPQLQKVWTFNRRAYFQFDLKLFSIGSVCIIGCNISLGFCINSYRPFLVALVNFDKKLFPL